MPGRAFSTRYVSVKYWMRSPLVAVGFDNTPSAAVADPAEHQRSELRRAVAGSFGNAAGDGRAVLSVLFGPWQGSPPLR